MNTDQTSSLSIRFLGVGNAGAAMLDRLLARSLPGIGSAVIDTDEASLAACAAAEKVCLEARTFRGLGTGGDPERGRELAEEQFGRLKSLCEGAQVVFLFAGLGGGVGSGAAPVVARAAKECGALVLGFVALPFDFEGARRMRQAERAHDALREFADGVVGWPNQKVFKLVDESTTVADTLRLANERMADGVCGLWRLLTQRGLMDVQFTDLCAVLRNAHQDAFFAAVEAAGSSRAAVAAEMLLAHPLLEGGAALAGTSAVLVGISAGANLTMAEVGRVMEAVNSRCGEAQVFVGAAEDATLGDRLHITLVGARPGAAAVEPLEAPKLRRGRPAPGELESEIEPEFLEKRATPRPRSRYVAPRPDMSPDQVEELARRQASGNLRGRKTNAKMRQGQLPLEIVSKGRFDKSEPTIRDGQDLDVPTFVRRNMVFN
ncbi:MAG TPA: cell division protein FtsZ [Verrucomicrobiae bacterium]|nr:cell division protein FtsZ [Verrucomicrobiae bacterium]